MPNTWKDVKGLMKKHRFKKLEVGPYFSHQLSESPKRILYDLSYYKFAAKMIGQRKVLDVGCAEGLGTWLLSKECGFAKGIDFDETSINVAKKNWQGKRISFECSDFLKGIEGWWDAMVAFDVIEHILPKNTSRFFQNLIESLTSKNGIVILGTPNITSYRYASVVSKAGHVNYYSGEKLRKRLLRYFSYVFMFGANDEVIHTGFLPMSHYLIAVGCGLKG